MGKKSKKIKVNKGKTTAAAAGGVNNGPSDQDLRDNLQRQLQVLAAGPQYNTADTLSNNSNPFGMYCQPVGGGLSNHHVEIENSGLSEEAALAEALKVSTLSSSSTKPKPAPVVRQLNPIPNDWDTNWPSDWPEAPDEESAQMFAFFKGYVQYDECCGPFGDKYSEKEVDNAIMELIELGLAAIQYNELGDHKLLIEALHIIEDVFVEQHNKKGIKSSWKGSGGPPFNIRTQEIVNGVKLFGDLTKLVEETFGKITEQFVVHYDRKDCSEDAEENDDDSEDDLDTFFDDHQDNFKRDFRICGTVGTSHSGKCMRFTKKKNERSTISVVFAIPHGFIVAMTRQVSGADHDEVDGGLGWHHAVYGVGGTTLFGWQTVVDQGDGRKGM